MLYEEGTKDIPLGKILAVLVEDEDDLAAFKEWKDEGSDAPAEAPKSAEPAPA